MRDNDYPKRYGIYGKDVTDGGNETDETEEIQMPPRMEAHSPVWSHIRKGSHNPYFGYLHGQVNS